MPVVKSREYRNISMSMFSALDEGYIVEGYATTFDDPYDFVGDTKEVISSRALDNADMSDVIFQFDHSGMVLARQRNKTLEVCCDDHGLKVRADLSKSQQGRDLYEAIKNGLVDRMSWGFTISDGGWEYDHATRTSTITSVDKVFDVSAVSLPANEGTEIKARNYLDGVIAEAEEQELLERAEKERMRQAIRIRMELS